MKLTEEIKNAIKSEKAILGYRRSIRFIKTNKPKLVVIAENTPLEIRKEIEHNAKIGGIKVKIFKGGSKELGVICGKPFPISTLVIRE